MNVKIFVRNIFLIFINKVIKINYYNTNNEEKFLQKYFIVLLIIISEFIFPQTKSINATRIFNPPELDGLLNDSVWASGKAVTDFLQQEPVPGSKPSFNTSVTVLYDNDNIYIGFMCYDDEPDKIVARELKLDGAWGADDNVYVFFDTFNDKRNAYWFGTNPLGMRDDALFTSTGNQRGFNESWNGIWDVKTAITDSGWSAELVFPFSTFKFFDSQEQTWGIDFQRGIARFGETIKWGAVGKDIKFVDIPHAGLLKGIKNVKRGNPVYFKPFLSVGFENTEENNLTTKKPGLDLKYGISQSLSLDVTINTDFSQVESDRAVINLSRFPFFFPEKREFFLEGASIFNFGLGRRNDLFYSRTIGLSSGKEIPIIEGLKLVGRTDKFDLGILNVQTSAKDNIASTNFSVMRAKYDLYEQSSFGTFFANKVSNNGFNRTFGADLNLQTNKFLGDKNLNFTARIAKVDEKNGHPNSWAVRVFLDYPNDLIDQFMAYGFIQKNFNPEMGFMSRTGIQNASYNLRVTPRIDFHQIKKLKFTPIESFVELDKDNNLLTADLQFSPFGFTTVQGDEFEFNIKRIFDNVQEDFDLFDNNFIRVGRYWFTSYKLSLNTARTRQFYGGFNFEAGDFYNGTIKTFGQNITFVLNSHLSLSADYLINNISLPESEFTTKEIGGRILYDISTQLNSSLFAQWNNQSNELNINYRIKWEPKIGANLFFVINHLLSTENKLKTKDFTLLTKFVWFIVI